MLVETADMAYKKPQYLTPDEPQNDSPTIVRTIFLPSEPVSIQALIDGAISALFEDSNFEKFGVMTPEETAQWYRNLEISVKTVCEEIINCIENDEDVQEALNNFLTDGGYIPAGGIPALGDELEGITGKDIVGSDCDEASLYGKCLKIVEALDRTITDLLQIVEVFSNPLEGATIITAKIPVIGLVSISTQLIDWMISTATEVYQASYTEATQNELACAIYCLCIDSCNVTFDNVLTAYRASTGLPDAPPATGNLETFVEWLITVPQEIAVGTVASYHLFVLEVLSRMGFWFDLDYSYIINSVLTSTPTEPTCEECACGEPIVSWNWNTSGNFTVYPITDRLIVSGYPSFPAGTHSYAVGNLTTGALPQDITGFEADCEYNFAFRKPLVSNCI